MATSKFKIPPKSFWYTAEWEDVPTETMRISEYDVPLPKKPPKKYIKNYGLAQKNQKFKRIKLPKNFRNMPKLERERLVEYLWHRRLHGEWWYINGKEIYITGQALLFFDFWITEQGTKADFRMEAVEFFLFWKMCERSGDCFGMYIVKARRIGDTEKSLFLLWEICTRYRNSNGGMQHMTEEDAQKNFDRLVKSAMKAPWFFRPMNPSSSAPKKRLEFKYPPDIFTKKKAKAEKDNKHIELDVLPSLESMIDFEASVLGRYDGQRLRIWHCDEVGKMKAFNINSHWDKIKPTLALYNMQTIIGKAIMTTTVEDMKSGGSSSTLENAKTLWDKSDPNNLLQGRTTTGLFRYFRPATKSAAVDEFGFCDEVAAREWILAERQRLIDLTDYDGLSEFMRKYPLTPKDSFLMPHNECILFPALLEKRLMQINNNITPKGRKQDEYGNYIKPKAVRGDLVWSQGWGSDVRFIPNHKGRWCISQHPDQTVANKKEWYGKNVKPVASSMYTMGVDPIDHHIDGKKNTKTGKQLVSDGAAVVFRKYDPDIDGKLRYNEDGSIYEEDVYLMQTNQFVCDYRFRPNDPYEYYEDMVKTAMYYSCPMLIERQRIGLINHLRQNKLHHFVQKTPIGVLGELKNKKNKRTSIYGVAASPKTIGMYIGELKKLIHSYIDCYHHTRILEDHRKMGNDREVRTQCDLTVAAGFSLLATLDSKVKKKKEEKEPWADGLPFKKYPRNKVYQSQHY